MLLGKTEEKKKLGRPSGRWEENIRMGLRDRVESSGLGASGSG
jgi:hypothetical protein